MTTTVLVFSSAPQEIDLNVGDDLADSLSAGTHYVTRKAAVSAAVVVSAGPVFDTPQEVSVSLDDIPYALDLTQFLTGAVAPVTYEITENDQTSNVLLPSGTSSLVLVGGPYTASVTVLATDANDDTAELELTVLVTAAAGSASVTTAPGEGTADGLAPDVSADASATPGVGTAAAEGHAPTVTATAGVTANDDTAETVVGADPIAIDVLANDAGENLSITAASADGGQVTIETSDGSVTAQNTGALIPDGREYLLYSTAA